MIRWQNLCIFHSWLWGTILVWKSENPVGVWVFWGGGKKRIMLLFFLYLCCHILLVHQYWWVATFYKIKQMFWIHEGNGQDEFVLLRQLIKPADIRFGGVERLCWQKTSRTDTKILPGFTTNWYFQTQWKLVSAHPESKGKSSLPIDLRRSSPRIIAQNYNSNVHVK